MNYSTQFIFSSDIKWLWGIEKEDTVHKLILGWGAIIYHVNAMEGKENCRILARR